MDEFRQSRRNPQTMPDILRIPVPLNSYLYPLGGVIYDFVGGVTCINQIVYTNRMKHDAATVMHADLFGA